MARIAQQLQPVPLRRLGVVIGGVQVDHGDAAAAPADPHHLLEHRERVEEVMKSIPRHHDRKGAVGKWQRGHIALPEGDVREAFLGG